jgi:hypothetical protein
MRLTGFRRGIPKVRFMVEQAARRRMWSARSRDPEARGTEPGAGAVQRWGPEFFEQVRGVLLPRMAPVAETPAGELRYLGSSAMSLWALVSDHALAIAHDHDDTPGQIRERAGRWLSCLTTRTAPGLASPYWGHPVYGARLDPLSGALDVVWALPGEWCEAVLSGSLPQREWDAPRSWQAEPALSGA